MLPDHISASQLTSWEICPRSWAYDKLAGKPFKGGANLHAGSALDHAITAHLQARIDGKDLWQGSDMDDLVVETYRHRPKDEILGEDKPP